MHQYLKLEPQTAAQHPCATSITCASHCTWCGLETRGSNAAAIATQNKRPTPLPQAEDLDDARLKALRRRAGKLVRKDRRTAQQQGDGPQPRGFA